MCFSAMCWRWIGRRAGRDGIEGDVGRVRNRQGRVQGCDAVTGEGANAAIVGRRGLTRATMVVGHRDKGAVACANHQGGAASLAADHEPARHANLQHQRQHRQRRAQTADASPDPAHAAALAPRGRAVDGAGQKVLDFGRPLPSPKGRRRGPRSEAEWEDEGLRSIRPILNHLNPSPSRATSAGPSLSLRERCSMPPTPPARRSPPSAGSPHSRSCRSPARGFPAPAQSCAAQPVRGRRWTGRGPPGWPHRRRGGR